MVCRLPTGPRLSAALSRNGPSTRRELNPPVLPGRQLPGPLGHGHVAQRKGRESNPQGSALVRVVAGCRRQSACPSIRVGTAGFEPAFSCVRGTRPLQAGPRPEIGSRASRTSDPTWCVCHSATGPLKQRGPGGSRTLTPVSRHPVHSRFVCTLLPLGTVARAPSGGRTRAPCVGGREAAAPSWVLLSSSPRCQRAGRCRPNEKGQGSGDTWPWRRSLGAGVRVAADRG